MGFKSIDSLRTYLMQGHVIPAHPLALNPVGKFDPRRQRALTLYYCAAGVGGVAVGVHTTQFAIRDAKHGLFEPVIGLAAETADACAAAQGRPIVKVGGVCGETKQATHEAELLTKYGYEVALVSLAAIANATTEAKIEHCRAIADIVPIMGFYLQPAVGGGVLPYTFWRQFAEIENVLAIKIAPFNRYQTHDVIRAVAEAGRLDDIALYTGNDDNIVVDLLTTYRLRVDGKIVRARMVGGLLGHWACWTRQAVHLLEECKRIVEKCEDVPAELLTRAVEVTDSNAAFFDAANGFAGCIPGVHEVLRRQGLLEGCWCLDESEMLSAGQSEEIDRVYAAYPHLNDDAFVAQHLDEWMK